MPRWIMHGIDAGADVLEALDVNGFGQDGGGGGAVAGNIAGLAGDHVHQLGAHVFKRLRQLDLLGDGDAVLGDARAAERFLQDDVAAARAERRLDRPRQLAQTGGDLGAGIALK